MKLLLIAFSQDMDIENMGSMLNFLVFRKEDGSTFRLPVPEETVQELVPHVVDASPAAQVAKSQRPAERRQESAPQDPGGPEVDGPGPEDDAQPTEFGGEEVTPGEGSNPELEDLPPIDGVRGQLELTREDLIQDGMSAREADEYLAKQSRPVAAAPPPVPRVLKRPGKAPKAAQRSLLPNDDGVPGL